MIAKPALDALRARIKRGVDLATFVGASLGVVIVAVERARGTSKEPWVAVAIMVALATCGLLGLLGKARWTPVAYLGLIVAANIVYLASYGTWFGLGAVYVLASALAFLFVSTRWSTTIAIGLVVTPLALGILFALGILPAAPVLALDDPNAWMRAGTAAITGLVGIAIVVSYTVSQLVKERRDIEATAVLERAQRLERVRVEDELARARRANSIAQLAAEVGADIGAALSIIAARAQALAAELHGSEARECLSDITEATSSAGTTMRSLTVFAPDAKLATSGNASDAARALTKLVRRMLPARIALQIDADDDAWVGIGTTDLARICANLVLNARDAIAEAGTIVLRVAVAPGHVVITVRDTGTGMPAAVLDQLFQPFFTTKPVGRGTGLGLATTKILVERAEGTIAIASEVGRGTTITIRLPLLEPQTPIPRASHAQLSCN
ncbi:MAG: HAMP domain-containing sensor histidine kinase [Kofleriaceae bacterium]